MSSDITYNIMVLNQYGANIPYPYHSLPLRSTEDRLGLYALLGIIEAMQGNAEIPPPNDKGNSTMDITLDCGRPPK